MLVNERDNVLINVENGHKVARFDIKKGENVIKYGYPIGHATSDIKKGEHIHTHNLKTNLSGKLEYTYNYKDYGIKNVESDLYFEGYERENGEVGIRNEIWIINTVGCVNKTAQILSEKTGARYFPHPYGCSQLGDDQKTTQKILCGLINHPNAGGVLVLGLGCENNNIEEMKKVLGEYNPNRVKFLVCQEHSDEISEGVSLINELKAYASTFKRTKIPVNKLKIGLKCGGSDGYSGITANPLVGSLCDRHASYGGTCALTEVPEMFGAEERLMERCESYEVFEKAVSLINDFKDYYERNNQVIYENPSPGNKAGGITTLEEKSLGCVTKGGLSVVTDVITYGQRLTKNGLCLVNGPGNDIVAVTNLTAVGCHMILFTTGRGTPLGAPVPTLKISTNKNLASKKPSWIDFDASPLIEGEDMAEMTDKLMSLVLQVASGKETKNEINGYREIAIFKDGVTL